MALTAAVVVGYALLGRFYRPLFSLSSLWPLSLFSFRAPTGLDALRAALCLLVYASIRFGLRTPTRSFGWVLAASWALILSLNFIPGATVGFVRPISGRIAGGLEYYHDATHVRDPGAFLGGFAELQPVLLPHSATHPPGAVLLHVALIRVLGSPLATSLALATLSILFLAFGIRRFLARELDRPSLEPDTARLVVLFALTPAIAIYTATVLDALVAGLLLAALAFFTDASTPRNLAAACALVGAASFLTFAFVLPVAVMAGFELWEERSLRKTLWVGASLVAMYGLLLAGTGFHYWDAFRYASASENPLGFRLLVEPVNYLATRLASALEIPILFSPFLALVAVSGLASAETPRRLRRLSLLALLGLALFLASGALPTGEAARPLLFIYPFLFAPAASVLSRCREDRRVERLTDLVFLESLLFQTFGSFFW